MLLTHFYRDDRNVSSAYHLFGGERWTIIRVVLFELEWTIWGSLIIDKPFDLPLGFLTMDVAKVHCGFDVTNIPSIRGNLGSKMGLIRKRSEISFCELEFKNQ